MSEMTLTRMRLAEGVWEGLLSAQASVAPRLLLRHRDELVGEPETVEAGEGGRWLVRFRLPVERLSDGVQTFVVLDRVNGETLTSFSIVAGEPLADDLRSEIDLLRSELDLLKRAFRRHCVETMDDGQP